MKHILNNLSEEEKNSIREQHAGGMKVMTENFSKLLNSKLGDAKPLLEQTDLDYKSLASRLEKAMKGMGTDNDEVFAVLHNIDTKEQFNNLVKAFGIRDGQNLNQWIAGDIWSGYEWNKNIVPFYQRIGVPVPPVNANVANAVNKIGNTIKGAFNEQMGMEDDFEGSENMEDSINTTTNVPLFGNVKNYHREKKLSPNNWGKKINYTIEALNLDELNEKLKKVVKNQQFNSGFPNLNVYSVSIKDKGNNNGVDLSYSFSYSDPKTDGYNFISIVFNPKGQSQESKNNALSKNPGSKVVNTGTFNFQNKEYEYHLIGIPLKFQ